MKSRLKRFAVVLIAVITLTAIASCDVLRSIGQIAPEKKLGEQELARLVTEAVQSESSVADCYSQIPKSQLDNVTYTAFSEYVSILRSMSIKHGEVDSFRILSEEACSEYFESVSGYSESIKGFDSYGDLDVITLCYSNDRSKDLADCSFVLQKGEDGTYNLAGSYITDTILTYDFISHYFSMISEGNTDALCAILSPTYSSDIYIDSVINAKAEYIIDYYNLRVKSMTEDYEITCLAPMLISYVIPETIDSDGTSVVSHSVDLMVDKNGSFCLYDVIPVNSAEPVYLYAAGEKALVCGSFYTGDSVEAILGEALYTISPEDPSEVTVDDEGKEHNIYKVLVSYNGLLLRFDAEYRNGDPAEWEGTLTSIRLYDISTENIYSFNQDITVGMNMAELLLIYPVIDEYGFVYSFDDAGETYQMIPEFDDYGNISKIQLVMASDT